MEGGNTYYRAEMPAAHLPGVVAPLDNIVERKEWVEIRRPGKPLEVRLTRQKSNCAIWMFSGNITRGTLMGEQMDNGLRVLMEVDDNYQVPSSNHAHSQWVEKFEGTHESSFELHTAIARQVDGMVVTTPQLAKEYADVNENIYVCPNSVETRDWEEPKKLPYLLDNLQRRKINVGWAASDSHWKDISLVAKAFEKLYARGDVQLWIYGIQPELFKYNFHFNYVPWADNPKDYFKSLSVLDIAVCPLREGVWEDCKSDVKALEATMAGAATVVSKVEPYRPWWGGENCLVAGTGLLGFIEPLEYLLNNKAEIRRLAASAKDYILRERTIERSIDTWRAAVCGS